jgi:hypothetical protein
MAWYTRKEFNDEIIKALNSRLFIEKQRTGLLRLLDRLTLLESQGKPFATPNKSWGEILKDLGYSGQEEVEKGDIRNRAEEPLYAYINHGLLPLCLGRYVHRKGRYFCSEVGLTREVTDSLLAVYNRTSQLQGRLSHNSHAMIVNPEKFSGYYLTKSICHPSWLRSFELLDLSTGKRTAFVLEDSPKDAKYLSLGQELAALSYK